MILKSNWSLFELENIDVTEKNRYVSV